MRETRMKNIMTILFLVACAYFIASLTACSTFQAAPNIQVESPKVVVTDNPRSVSLPGMKPEWSQAMIAELKAQLPNLDKASGDMAKRFCPHYNEMLPGEKLVVWGHLTSAMIRFESGMNGAYFKTCSSMTESNGVDSIGLFQLSYGDSFCPRSKSEGNLCDVAVNIKCGVKIIGSLVAKDGVIAAGGYQQYGATPAKGAARYWSVLRVPDSKRKHQLAEIRELTSHAPGCK